MEGGVAVDYSYFWFLARGAPHVREAAEGSLALMTGSFFRAVQNIKLENSNFQQIKWSTSSWDFSSERCLFCEILFQLSALETAVPIELLETGWTTTRKVLRMLLPHQKFMGKSAQKSFLTVGLTCLQPTILRLLGLPGQSDLSILRVFPPTSSIAMILHVKSAINNLDCNNQWTCKHIMACLRTKLTDPYIIPHPAALGSQFVASKLSCSCCWQIVALHFTVTLTLFLYL